MPLPFAFYGWMCAIVLLALVTPPSQAKDIRNTDLNPIEESLLAKWHRESEAFEKFAAERSYSDKSFESQFQRDLDKVAEGATPPPPKRISPEAEKFISAKTRAEAGDVQAQMELAVMYDTGYGT